ncbi:unnamed protein product, partial [Discosporangium mesarthrocarpum]
GQYQEADPCTAIKMEPGVLLSPSGECDHGGEDSPGSFSSSGYTSSEAMSPYGFSLEEQSPLGFSQAGLASAIGFSAETTVSSPHCSPSSSRTSGAGSAPAGGILPSGRMVKHNSFSSSTTTGSGMTDVEDDNDGGDLEGSLLNLDDRGTAAAGDSCDDAAPTFDAFEGIPGLSTPTLNDPGGPAQGDVCDDANLAMFVDLPDLVFPASNEAHPSKSFAAAVADAHSAMSVVSSQQANRDGCGGTPIDDNELDFGKFPSR